MDKRYIIDEPAYESVCNLILAARAGEEVSRRAVLMLDALGGHGDAFLAIVGSVLTVRQAVLSQRTNVKITELPGGTPDYTVWRAFLGAIRADSRMALACPVASLSGYLYTLYAVAWAMNGGARPPDIGHWIRSHYLDYPDDAAHLAGELAGGEYLASLIE